MPRLQTRPSSLVCLALAALLVTPAAAAHGAPEARPFEERVLTDTTELGDYGGPPLSEDGPGAFDEGAWDLLALDTRDARLANGTPAWVVRVVAQSLGDPAPERTIVVSFLVDGIAHNATIVESSGSLSTPDAARLEGPVPVGDNHTHAFDLWLDARRLALEGTEATDMRVRSLVGGAAADDMPGGWHRTGVPVGTAAEDIAGGVDPYAGPAVGVVVRAEGEVAAPAAIIAKRVEDNGTILLTLEERFGVAQTVGLAATVVQGDAEVDVPDTFVLNASQTRTVEVPVRLADDATASVQMEVYSDLGAWSRVTVDLQNDRDAANTTTTTAPVEDEDSTHPGVLVPVLVFAAVAWRRRR